MNSIREIVYNIEEEIDSWVEKLSDNNINLIAYNRVLWKDGINNIILSDSLYNIIIGINNSNYKYFIHIIYCTILIKKCFGLLLYYISKNQLCDYVYSIDINNNIIGPIINLHYELVYKIKDIYVLYGVCEFYKEIQNKCYLHLDIEDIELMELSFEPNYEDREQFVNNIYIHTNTNCDYCDMCPEDHITIESIDEFEYIKKFIYFYNEFSNLYEYYSNIFDMTKSGNKND